MKIKLIFILSIAISFLSFSQNNNNILSIASEELENRLLGNSIGESYVKDNELWIGTSRGLSKTTDDGITWQNFLTVKEFTKPNISSLIIWGDTIFTSLAYTKVVPPLGNVVTGDGFTISSDGGKSWVHYPQAKDDIADTIITYGINKIPTVAVIVDEQNITYDCSIFQNTIWIASWSSGIRKSTNLGETFERVVLPPDNLFSIHPNDTLSFRIHPVLQNNHVAFAVLAVDSLEIWAGTADGVNKSTDGGISWRKFNSLSRKSWIVGDWVIHINQQKYKDKNRIWTTNWKSDTIKRDYGGSISYTEDGGETWTSFTLLNERRGTNYLAFKDSIIYVATSIGIFRSDNDGKSFELFDNFYDKTNGNKVLYPEVYTISISGDKIWFGTSDGLVSTIDNADTKFGTEWSIKRTYQPMKANSAYAYPNPFSPSYEMIRINYTMPKNSCNVSIDIFDFGMNHIRTIFNNIKSGSLTQEDIWDGLDNNSKLVANGVYFYRIRIDSEDIWGKILVLK